MRPPEPEFGRVGVVGVLAGPIDGDDSSLLVHQQRPVGAFAGPRGVDADHEDVEAVAGVGTPGALWAIVTVSSMTLPVLSERWMMARTATRC